MPNPDEEAVDPLADEQDEDQDVVDAADDDDEFEEDDDLEEDEEDAGEIVDEEAEPTAEVGSEGGSPGEAVLRGRTRETTPAGSEASETWRPSDAGESTTELRDDDDVLVKRAP